MLRRVLFAFVVLFCSAGGLFAAEYKNATIMFVDAKKYTITVEVDGKNSVAIKIIKCNDKTKFLDGKDGKEELTEGLKNKAFEKAKTVTIKTNGEGDKEVATEVTVTSKN